MTAKVLILGDGVAACGVAHLLTRARLAVAVEREMRAKPVRLLIGEQSRRLLQDVFGDMPAVNAAPAIARRVVQWGDAAVVEMPHSGAVVAEQEMLAEIWPRITVKPASEVPVWTVVTALANFSAETGTVPELIRFGRRQAMVQEVQLMPDTVGDACWVESVEDGWLFLLPRGDGRAVLIASGYEPEGLLAQSRLVVQQIVKAAMNAGKGGYAVFPVAPAVLSQLCGKGWLACGSAAMSFDPLCGEGAGFAAREALLASAVIRAAEVGQDVEALLMHYETRMRQGFLRHLQHCLGFYESGGNTAFWREEAAELRRGITWVETWLQSRQAEVPAVRFRFDGYDLVALGMA